MDGEDREIARARRGTGGELVAPWLRGGDGLAGNTTTRRGDKAYRAEDSMDGGIESSRTRK
jgi:hypothetical protein